MKTKFASKNSIKCDLKNYVNFKYTRSFQRKVLPNLTCASLTKCILEAGSNSLKLKTTVLKTLQYLQKTIHDGVYSKGSYSM